MQLTAASVDRDQLDQALGTVARTLGPDVKSVSYELRDDWSGDPAIFFHVVLADEACTPSRRKGVRGLEWEIVRSLSPLERWGVLPYFSYRSETDQKTLGERPWA